MMTLQREQKLVKGGVLYALADTLAAHNLGGFKMGVGFSLRICRMCLATQEQSSTKVSTSFYSIHVHGFFFHPNAMCSMSTQKQTCISMVAACCCKYV